FVLVRALECARDFARDTQCVIDRQPCLAVQPVPKRFAGDEWHHVVQQRSAVELEFARIVEWQDVRMREPRGNPDFPQEPFSSDRSRDLRVQNLYRDVSIVPYVMTEKYTRHSAPTQFALDRVQ